MPFLPFPLALLPFLTLVVSLFPLIDLFLALPPSFPPLLSHSSSDSILRQDTTVTTQPGPEPRPPPAVGPGERRG